jgi:hypothetical protein
LCFLLHLLSSGCNSGYSNLTNLVVIIP